MRLEPRLLKQHNTICLTFFCVNCGDSRVFGQWYFQQDKDIICVKCSDKEDQENNVAY